MSHLGTKTVIRTDIIKQALVCCESWERLLKPLPLMAVAELPCIDMEAWNGTQRQEVVDWMRDESGPLPHVLQRELDRYRAWKPKEKT